MTREAATPSDGTVDAKAEDWVTCGFTPYLPSKEGGHIYATVTVRCTPHGPDINTVTVRLWRYDTARGEYYLDAENTVSDAEASWSISASTICPSTIHYLFHTQVLADTFYGNWTHVDGNSGDVDLTC